MVESHDKREALRQELLKQSGAYSPWVHLMVPSLTGVGLMAAAVVLMRGLSAFEVGFGVLLFVLANAAEWRIHKSLLHRRTPPLTLLYDRHTPQHHRVFVTDDMAIRDLREFKLVLLPAYAVVTLAAALLPLAALIWHLGYPNHACVFIFVTMGYVVTYEWLHLSYHLPPESFIGRLGLVRFMRRHHAIHHDPKVMQRWNFNVSLPLWDVVRRTYVRPAPGESLEPSLKGG